MRKISLGIAAVVLIFRRIVQASNDFFLFEKQGNRQYGPYQFRNDTQVFDAQLELTVNTNGTFQIKGFSRGILFTYGPFAATNNAKFLIGTREFTFVRGKDVDAFKTQVAKFAESQKAKGLVEVDGNWITHAQAEEIKRIREAVDVFDEPLAKYPDSPNPSEAQTLDLNATVSFNGTQFVIANGDSFDWTNVKLEINSKTFSSGYTLETSVMKAGETYTVGAMQFAKSDGERFNPFTYKAVNLSIYCDTTKGRGFYYGTWK